MFKTVCTTARQLKDSSLQIFGALIENALSTTMRNVYCVRTAKQKFVQRSGKQGST